MRNLSRYVVAVVGVGVLIAIGVSCGDSRPTPPAGLTEVQVAGWNAYVDLACGNCHGASREGKRSGPTLTGLEAHWTEDGLVSYLEDPQKMVKTNPRLAYKSEKYAIAMPAYAQQADSETLKALAGYLLVDIE